MTGHCGRRTRELELAEALSAVRARLAHAAEAAGRNVDEIELLPDYQILSGHRRRYFAPVWGARHLANPANRKRRIKRPKSAQCWVPSRFAGTWSGGSSATKRARSPAGPTPHTRSTAPRSSPRWTGPRPGRWPRAAGQSRCASTSRSASTATRSGVGLTSAGRMRIDELCAAAQAAEGLEFVGLMAIPPLGADPAEAFARLAGERERVQRSYPQRLGLSAGMSSDLEMAVKHGSTCVRVGTALLGQRPLTSP